MRNFARMEKWVRVIGYAALLFGAGTAISAPLPGWGAPLALMMMIPGFLLSSVYILLSNKYEVKSGFIHPGYIGLLLSSTPVLLIIYFQFVR
ncbi:MAG: hypothetical protein Fur0041_15510 [Bacteroidia bacterium]